MTLPRLLCNVTGGPTHLNKHQNPQGATHASKKAETKNIPPSFQKDRKSSTQEELG